MRRLRSAAPWITLGIAVSITVGVGAVLRYPQLLRGPAVSYEAAVHISWEKAVRILNEGRVREVGQSHSLKVWLTLADGTRYVTEEPRIDEIWNEIRRCGEPCKDIYSWTE